MESMLQAVVVVFMMFLCALCLFAVVVIVRDIIHENGRIRRARDRAEIRERFDNIGLAEILAKITANKKTEDVIVPAPVSNDPMLKPVVLESVVEKVPVVEEIPVVREIPVVQDIPVVEVAPVAEVAPVVEAPVEVAPVVEEAPVAVEPTPTEDENAVVFSRQTLTLEERYATLSTEYKRYFDDIIRHAMAKEGVRELKYTNYNDYKNGSYKVLRITIKRGEIVCEFQFLDRDFLNYANSSSVKMKQSATTIKISEPSAVGAVKDGIDLVCSQIAEDKAYKKNLANEKRREKRKKDREEAPVAAPAPQKKEAPVAAPEVEVKENKPVAVAAGAMEEK